MSSELGSSGSPRKWRYTWEAQSHIPTIRLLLFNPLINPNTQCSNLEIDLNLGKSWLLVSWFEDGKDVSLGVPIPKVLVDVESPLSFKAMDDHIEVRLVLLLPVDHPTVSNFDSLLNLSENEHFEDSEDVSNPLVMDSDLKPLSSRGGGHFYCRNCSTKLTKSPLGYFVEMPSANWREVADNWFGACCCSFGGISEKLVTKYANSYSCAQGTCLLSDTFITLCKDDLIGCNFPEWEGCEKCDFVADNHIETKFCSKSNNVGKISCEDDCGKVRDVDVNFSSVHRKKENLPASLECESNGEEIVGESVICSKSEKLTSAQGCCIDRASCELNHDSNNCSNNVSEVVSKDQELLKTVELVENQISFLNGFLGNLFMVRSSYLSKDIDWINFCCPQCSSVIGAYPCNGHGPLDGGVRLFKCYISTCMPFGKSGDLFRKYTLERMFANKLLENAKDELSFRTVVRDLVTKSPVLQIVILNPDSWFCSGHCLGTADTMESAPKIDLCPVLKVLFSDCSNSTESQLRIVEEWLTRNKAEEVYMLSHQIKELSKSLKSAQDVIPASYAFLQGLPLSFIQR